MLPDLSDSGIDMPVPISLPGRAPVSGLTPGGGGCASPAGASAVMADSTAKRSRAAQRCSAMGKPQRVDGGRLVAPFQPRVNPGVVNFVLNRRDRTPRPQRPAEKNV